MCPLPCCLCKATQDQERCGNSSPGGISYFRGLTRLYHGVEWYTRLKDTLYDALGDQRSRRCMRRKRSMLRRRNAELGPFHRSLLSASSGSTPGQIFSPTVTRSSSDPKRLEFLRGTSIVARSTRSALSSPRGAAALRVIGPRLIPLQRRRRAEAGRGSTHSQHGPHLPIRILARPARHLELTLGSGSGFRR